MELVSCNSGWRLTAVTNDSNLIVKSHKADFAIRVVLMHGVELTIDGALYALEARNIGDAMISLEALIGAITKLHKLSLNGSCTISLKSVITSNRLSHAHTTRDINAEDHRDILRLGLVLLVQDLSCSLENVVDSISLRYFLRLELDLVFSQAEFAIPYLI
jgi:hypothetical protein